MGDLGGGFTLEEAISSIGFGNFHVLALVFAGLGWASSAMGLTLLSALVFAGLGWASSAMGLTLLSVIAPRIKSEWGLSSSEESMLTSVAFAGTCFGAYFWGYISDAYGRRVSCIGTMMCTGGVLFLTALSPGYVCLLALLFLFGCGAGGVHVFASWFLEFAPTSSRGSWTAAISHFYSIGNILAASLAWVIMPRLGWRWLIVSSCIPPLTVFLIGFIIPESPRYLCMKGKTNEAYRALEKVALLNGKEVPPGVLIFSPLTQNDEEFASSEEGPFLDSLEKKTGNSRSQFLSALMLFSPKLLKTTLMIWLVYFGTVFAYYGIIFLTSELSTGLNRCTPLVHVEENTQQDDTSYASIFINSLAELPSAFIAAGIVDRAGRKLSIVMTSTLSFCLLLPLIWHQSDIVTTVLLFGARMLIAAGMTILSVFGNEVYPTSVRSTGAGLMTTIGSIGGMICPLVAVVLIEGCHQRAAFALFEVVIVLIGVSAFMVPVETSRKELSDVLPSDDEE